MLISKISSLFKKIILEEGMYGLFFRIKTRVYFIVYKAYKFIGLKKVPSAYGYNFHANYSDSTFQLYIKGGYGSYYWKRIKKIKYNFIFLDIGANAGLYSISALKNKYIDECYAFEPVIKTTKYLKNNFILNNCKDKYSIINKAISNFNGQSNINIEKNNSGRANLRDNSTFLINGSNKSIINCINANDLNNIILNKKKLPIVVKIDVEGHEAIILNELFNSTFKNYIKEIFLEIDERWVNKDGIFKNLYKEGFTKIKKIGSDKTHYDIIATK